MSLKHRKLGRTSDQRRAMLRAMVTYLLENGQIKTTITRAKEVAPLAEKMITLAKQNDLAAYRQALGFITKEDVAFPSRRGSFLLGQGEGGGAGRAKKEEKGNFLLTVNLVHTLYWGQRREDHDH